MLLLLQSLRGLSAVNCQKKLLFYEIGKNGTKSHDFEIHIGYSNHNQIAKFVYGKNYHQNVHWFVLLQNDSVKLTHPSNQPVSTNLKGVSIHKKARFLISFFPFFLVYIPVNASLGEDQVRLFLIAGTDYLTTVVGNTYGIVTNYTWNIKATQIDCGFNNPLRGKKNNHFKRPMIQHI